MIWVKNIFIYWPGRQNFGTGGVISANLLTGEATEVHLTGVLGQAVNIVSAVGY